MGTSKKIWPFIVALCLFCHIPCQAQKVGLVLSGGGAKGLTHIGIIRALEENNIPIDYITGTSMGAIIGSLYAMGYTPDEMETLIRSEQFRRWYTGEIEEEYIYYFKENLPTPEFINIRLNLKNLKESRNQILPTSLVNPVQMNFACMELFAPGTAACRGNFDQLFVPFRCVASDVYNKRQIVMRNGDLGDAVRASMSFPLVFKPIEVDSTLAYDGGIYNNFPTDVMREDFHPDIIIGSVVASNPSKPDEKNLYSQLESMIMQKTDYSLPDSAGILMTFKYKDINLLDFDRIDELTQRGYDRTMSLMDSIKSRIPRRMDAENVRLRRMVFKSHMPQLSFRGISVEGANEQQQEYIKREFHKNDEGVITFEEAKKAYFRLLSNSIITEIIPHAVFRPESDTYDLILNVKMGDKFSVRIGGGVSSTASNQMYFGVSYQDLNYYSREITFDGQIGKMYNNLQLAMRLDLPTQIPTSYKLIGSISTFDYYKKDKLFSWVDKPSFTRKKERFAKMKVALPFLSNKKAEFSFGAAHVEDQYLQGSVVDFDDKERFDKSSYILYGGSIFFGGSTLNSREYATGGLSEALIAQIYSGNERFHPGKETEGDAHYKERHTWLQISYQREAYKRLRPHFVLGSHIEAFYSSKNFSENYTATLLQAGEFTPTVHSRMSYNEAFRANQFIALGVKPIYTINPMFHIRSEFYGFLPIFPIRKNSQNKAYYGDLFSEFEYIGELSVVCTLPFGAITAYINHYSSPAREWNFGVTIGWHLFNTRFIE